MKTKTPQRIESMAAGFVSPPPPAAPFFDTASNAWVLSRYRDVLDALREPALRQAGPEEAPAEVRAHVLETLSAANIAEWQERIGALAYDIIAVVSGNHPIDLVSDVLRPWSLGVATIVLGLDASGAQRLAALEPHLFDDQAGPVARGSLRWARTAVQRRIANKRLERLLRESGVREARSLFMGVSHISVFLARAWLVLLEHPDQLLHLRADRDLMPRAIEELLRYAGTVHTLQREADRTIDLAGITIQAGGRVTLKLGSANRDPEQFSDPDSLDIQRRGAGQLGLGGGSHSCVGALLVRSGAISATRAFADKFAGAELITPVVWRLGPVHDSPLSLRVRSRQTSTS